MEKKTKVFSDSKEKLSTELCNIREEIATLEKLLKEARLKELQYVQAIEKEQDSIDAVKEELSLEWSDLSQEKLSIQHREDQLQDEEVMYFYYSNVIYTWMAML